MHTFQYVVKIDGQLHEGVVPAVSSREVEALLEPVGELVTVFKLFDGIVL
ncbi:hypothetical protein HDG34_005839 [Paraburkholderia sp. HC6.4b]|nr:MULTISPECIES: hypothetical protein [unclassified Paraburkholderia]MBB5411873.1 hypothetical protein [Paraburkholderia sp. HC6.4b]MBB5450185.1 hypothetical protein [Paraburkholderia sp. Kb1A]